MCLYITGLLDNKPIIYRGCGTGHGILNDGCHTENGKFNFEGRHAKNVKLCACSGNNCNNQKYSNNKPPKNGSTSNGSSSVRFAFLSLFVIGFAFTSGNY